MCLVANCNGLKLRKQLIKLQGDLSSWADIQKGVPQSSILGPLLFKFFINDIFYFIEYGTLYNYADDNTLSYVNDNYEKLIDILEKESSVLIDWFKFNCMQANPDKSFRDGTLPFSNNSSYVQKYMS
jgi:hypothetical protein